MRIFYLCQYFPPEIGAPAVRVSELATEWTAAGHDVTVVTGFPNHPSGRIPPEYMSSWRRVFRRECYGDVDVVRCWLIPLPNRKPWERIVNYSSFFLTSVVRGLSLRRPDVLIATSPQLLVGLSGWIVSRVKRIPFVFEVRDMWPEAIIASGIGTDRSLLSRLLRRLSAFLYKHADHIVIVSPAYEGEIEKTYGIGRAKMSVIQNGVDTNLFRPADGREMKERLGVTDRFVVSYIGTVGYAHGLSMIVEAAELLAARGDERMVFLIAGDGAERAEIEAKAQLLSNLIFLGPRPRSEIPGIIAASDVCAVLLKKARGFETVIPTKMLEFMACERPVVLGVEGQARAILEAAGGGLTIEPEDIDGFLAALEKLRTDPDLARRLGADGRRYIEANLSRPATAQDYLGVLSAITGSHAGGRRAG